MKKINYKSDFDFILRLLTATGEDVGWPPYDWQAVFRTSSRDKVFRAGCTAGVPHNCYNDNGRIHIVADNHGLPPGKLFCELSVNIPEDIFPDGARLTVTPAPLDITLTVYPSDLPTSAEVEAQLPCIKGEPFRYEDFTPEQIAELQQPATEAARDAEIKMVQLNDTITGKADRAELPQTSRQSFDDVFTYLAGANGNIDYSHMESGVLKPYYLNTLWLTYKEAMAVVQSAMDFCANAKNTNPGARTNILTWRSHLLYNGAPAGAFLQRPELEVVRVSPDTANGSTGCNIGAIATCSVGMHHAFSNCSRLHTILGVMVFDRPATNTTLFPGCKALVDFKLYGLRSNLNLAEQSKLSLTSLNYMIVTAANGTTKITVTVHPDVFAKLTDETNAEWSAVLAKAVEKNITFAIL